MFDFLFGLEAKRRGLSTKVPKGPLKNFLSVPFPEPNTPISEVPMLALDFETSGFNATTDHLLSIGHVEINQLSIKLASAEHYLLKSGIERAGDNVAIHQITELESQQGLSLENAIERLLNAMAGKVILVHYAKIEQTFLAAACKALYGYAPVFPIIDSLVVAKNRLDQRQAAYDPSNLRLTNLRDSYQLPAHYAHNALNDAVATGELLLAEIAHHHSRQKPLKHFLR
ncbi:DNA polymerase III subunit epsilon [Thalassotalea sp. M1531]|uniref:DNA polymerase III subunit epsilon n=1 Tax=Thalassotalea algicola TaxID=2716224 RepID=A0A7Y0Q7I6_9GAMM|nr:exonuclease domain-containing protein [Thalassotalea algicola]NMP33109.1 DNA polymerase III subunit epsilon [Thalassotalea algicola]